MHRLLAVTLLACQAQQPSDLGPTFGGDPSFAAAARALDGDSLPDPGTLTEAGLLAGRPLAVGDGTCEARACVSARSAWMDDTLAVAVGVDGVAVRPPVDLAFLLDVSCSTVGAEDVRATPVEIALDHLGGSDQLAIWAFAGEPVELLPLDGVDVAEAQLVLEGIDRVHELAAVLAELPAEAEDFATLIAMLEDQGDSGSTAFDDLDALDTGLADTGLDVPTLDEAALALFYELQALVDASSNPALEPGLIALASSSGSAIDEAAEAALLSLPDGSSSRASRLIFVSDFDGPSALPAVDDAASRFVGTSVLGITPAADTSAMAALADRPGAHTFDATDPAQALAGFEQRFDSLVAPNAWNLDLDLDPVSEGEWTLLRRFGTTDPDERGANAFFASRGHGTLGLVLKPTVSDPSQPRFVLTVTTEDGEEAIGTFAKVPIPILTLPWGQGDDEVGLELARSIRLYDAVQAGDEAALDLWDPASDAL